MFNKTDDRNKMLSIFLLRYIQTQFQYANIRLLQLFSIKNPDNLLCSKIKMVSCVSAINTDKNLIFIFFAFQKHYLQV